MSHLNVVAFVVGLVIFAQVNGLIILKETEDAVHELDGEFGALQTLYHGDACSYPAYEKYVRHLDDYAKGQSVQQQELLNELVLNGESHCSYHEILVCSKKQQKCICGDVWEHAWGHQTNTYVREGQGCRVTVEGVCSSDWNYCAKGTTCVLDSSHDVPCTEENEQRPDSEEAPWDHGDDELPYTRPCTCQLSPSELREISEVRSEDIAGAETSRWKRGTNVSASVGSD